MTAPMTPSGPHTYPVFPGSGQHAPADPDGEPPVPGLAQDVRAGVFTALAVALGGVLLGALWLWLAPRVPLVSDGKAVYLKDSEGEAPIAADGWFALLGLAMGMVSAAVAFWRVGRGGVAVVIGLAVGGLLASLLGMWLGMWLGPSDDMVARAREAGVGNTFDAPLRLQAKAALLAWPVGAMVAQLLLTGAFAPRDLEPGHDKWGGWGPPAAVHPGPGTAPHDSSSQDRRHYRPHGHGGGDDPWAAPPSR